MKKINNFDEIQESTGFRRLSPGGYICAIYHVEDVPNKEYLKVDFDIVKGDEKGYFKKLYDSDTRKDKQWPNAGTTYRSYKDNAIPMFKGFITAIEKSNKNFKWAWDESKLEKKYFGAVIGEEEYQNQKGAVKVRNHVVGIRSVEAIESGDFDIPELKKLDAASVTKQTNDNVVNPFADDEPPVKNQIDSPIADDDDDDPFR